MEISTVPVEYWHWLVVGVLLLALEVFVPGAILMWFGFGALVTGAVLWLIPDLDMSWQLLLFSLLSVASLILWHKSSLGKEDSVPSPDPTLNNRLKSHIGRQYVLTSAIINGNGA
ncbi:MAG TPA: NfeD family protein, partial [Thiolinea sp.]|nr:NfeD family protein [Thiolinea sp.]